MIYLDHLKNKLKRGSHQKSASMIIQLLIMTFFHTKKNITHKSSESNQKNFYN